MQALRTLPGAQWSTAGIMCDSACLNDENWQATDGWRPINDINRVTSSSGLPTAAVAVSTQHFNFTMSNMFEYLFIGKQ
jgi:hypothetical protein